MAAAWLSEIRDAGNRAVMDSMRSQIENLESQVIRLESQASRNSRLRGYVQDLRKDRNARHGTARSD